MCNKCEKIVNCDEQHKAESVLLPKIEFTDAFGEQWEGEELVMCINHDEYTLAPNVFIGGGGAHRKDIPYVSYGNAGIDIKFCPFCGQKLY